MEKLKEELQGKQTTPEVITPAVKGGRCFNGAHRDRGQVVHAIPGKEENGMWQTKALCGSKPGQRSYGWSTTLKEVNCKTCLKKLTEYTNLLNQK